MYPRVQTADVAEFKINCVILKLIALDFLEFADRRSNMNLPHFKYGWLPLSSKTHLHISYMSNCIIFILALTVSGIALAKQPECPGDHPSCKDAAGGAGYSVTIVGADVEGASVNHWLGGPKGVGLNDAGVNGDVGELTHLNFFISSGQGAICFPLGNWFPHEEGEGYQLHQAQIKEGRGGRAEATFWFHGRTYENNIRVLYALALYGDFNEEDLEFPPVNDGETIVMVMHDWKMIVENERKAIKSISCIGKGTNDVTVTITVEKE